MLSSLRTALRLRDTRDIMSDTYTISLKNFRSIRDATVDLAPLTVIYGKNGSGKSSLLYGLLTLRNFLSNPNQNMPSLFSYPSIQLGGFNEIVYGHDNRLNTEMAVRVSNPDKLSSCFTLAVGESGGQVQISFDKPFLTKEQEELSLWNMPSELRLEIALPYSAPQLTSSPFAVDSCLIDDDCRESNLSIQGTIEWNGLNVLANRSTVFVKYNNHFLLLASAPTCL